MCSTEYCSADVPVEAFCLPPKPVKRTTDTEMHAPCSASSQHRTLCTISISDKVTTSYHTCLFASQTQSLGRGVGVVCAGSSRPRLAWPRTALLARSYPRVGLLPCLLAHSWKPASSLRRVRLPPKCHSRTVHTHMADPFLLDQRERVNVSAMRGCSPSDLLRLLPQGKARPCAVRVRWVGCALHMAAALATHLCKSGMWAQEIDRSGWSTLRMLNQTPSVLASSSISVLPWLLLSSCPALSSLAYTHLHRQH